MSEQCCGRCAASDARGADAGRWYSVSRDGAATLCVDENDARYEALKADREYPRSAPHRAARLVEANAAPAPAEPAKPEGSRETAILRSGLDLAVEQAERLVTKVAVLEAQLADRPHHKPLNARLLEAAKDLHAVLSEAMGTGGWVPTPLHASFRAAWGEYVDAIAAAEAQPKVAPLTDEQIDALLNDLDLIAQSFDHQHYGLPLFDSSKEQMRAAVRERLGIGAAGEKERP